MTRRLKSGRYIDRHGYVSLLDSEKHVSNLTNAIGVFIHGLIYAGTAVLASTLAIIAEQSLKLIPAHINSLTTAINIAKANQIESLIVLGAGLIGFGIAHKTINTAFTKKIK